MKTRARTFSKADWEESRTAWDEWDASAEMREEWVPWRSMAAEAGILWPPNGDRFDSWMEPHPSQLAILTRAIRETPDFLRVALRRPDVHSWGDVVGHVLSMVNARRDEIDDRLDEEERAWERTKRSDRRGVDLERLADILRRKGLA